MKRNCNQMYPIYPQPIMPPMMYPNSYQNAYDINTTDQKLKELEERISRLEKQVYGSNNYNKYNDNYYVV